MFNLWKLFFTSFLLPATYEKCKKIVTEKAVNHQDSDRIQVPSSIEWANTHFGGIHRYIKNLCEAKFFEIRRTKSPRQNTPCPTLSQSPTLTL